MNKGFDWRDRILWLLWKTVSRPRQSMGWKWLDSWNWWQFKHGYEEEECGVTNWILPISLFLKVRIKCKEGLLNQKEFSSTEGSCQQITNCKTEMLAICWRESPLRYISGSFSHLGWGGGYSQPIIYPQRRRGHTHCSHVNESIGCIRGISLKTSKEMEPYSLTKMRETTRLLTS